MNAVKLIRRFNRFRRNYTFDRRYGSFIGGMKKTPFAHLGANDTANISYEALPTLFRDVIRPSDVLVDVGCGRGRVLNWWLDQYPGHRIYGIELDRDVAAEVAARLHDYPVSILTGDVRKVAPPDGTVYFLYNPFKADVMADFLAMLKKRAATAADGIRVVYYNCRHLDLFAGDPDCRITPIRMKAPFHRAALITIGSSDG